MENPEYVTTVERLCGLALIWQEANYNFAFFGRQPDLDWDGLYKEYIPRVISAEDSFSYYQLLSRFTATLRDGHTLIIPPQSLYLSLDRPKLMLMNVGNTPIVTNASSTIGKGIAIGSQLLEINGVGAKEYLAMHVMPYISETTFHRLLDHAVARLLLGKQDSIVKCKFRTPGGDSVEMDLLRNRRIDSESWLRVPGVPDKWEFMYFDEWFFGESPFTAFEFEILDNKIAYVALNSFMDPTVVTSFRERLPAIGRCSGLILDLRKNHGGDDAIGYSIVAHFLKQPTEVLLVRSRKHVASYRASGISLKDTPADKIPMLNERAREQLLCFKKQWWHEEQWGNVLPCKEVFSLPTAILIDSETGSAAEDFIMAFRSGKGEATLIGRNTAGSSGQPLVQDLPGGGKLAVCTIQMPWPEETYSNGIEPDIYVEPTIKDVIRNEDRILMTAIQFLCGHDS